MTDLDWDALYEGGPTYTDEDGNEQYCEKYLMKDGNLGVPGGRYGGDTASCVPFALACYRIHVENGAEDTVDLLDEMMGHVVNSSDSVLSLIEAHGNEDEQELIEDQFATEFVIEIELGNAGMRTFDDISDALKAAADGLPEGRPEPYQAGAPITDGNGNTVGAWEAR